MTPVVASVLELLLLSLLQAAATSPSAAKAAMTYRRLLMDRFPLKWLMSGSRGRWLVMSRPRQRVPPGGP